MQRPEPLQDSAHGKERHGALKASLCQAGSVTVAGLAALLTLHFTAVLQCPVVGDLD